MECAAKGLNCSSPHLLQLQRKSIMGKSFCYNTERRYRPVTTRSLVKGLHHQCLDAVNNKEAAKRRKSDTHLQHIALHCLGWSWGWPCTEMNSKKMYTKKMLILHINKQMHWSLKSGRLCRNHFKRVHQLVPWMPFQITATSGRGLTSLKMIISSTIGKRAQVDFINYIRCPFLGYRRILQYVDHHSGFAQVAQLKRKTAKLTGRALIGIVSTAVVP